MALYMHPSSKLVSQETNKRITVEAKPTKKPAKASSSATCLSSENQQDHAIPLRHLWKAAVLSEIPLGRPESSARKQSCGAAACSESQATGHSVASEWRRSFKTCYAEWSASVNPSRRHSWRWRWRKLAAPQPIKLQPASVL